MKNRAFDHRHYTDWRKPEELIPYEKNAKIHDEKQIKNLVTSLKRFGWQQDCVVTSDNVLVIGHGRRMAAMRIGCEIPVHVIDKKAEALTDEDIRELRIADNQTNAETGFDFSLLQEDIEDLDFDGFDFDFNFETEHSGPDKEQAKAKLTDKFIIPPFSVLDTRQGYWIERQAQWRALIGDDGQARGDAQLFSNSLRDEKYSGTAEFRENSILDPVISEIMCRWFSPYAGSKMFDNFAGDTVFGYVSSFLGHDFTGIELRQEQADFNNAAIEGMSARYICDDGRNVGQHISPDSMDMYFSCPPYFDLEVYSDKENDASNQATYKEFYAILDTAFTEAAKCLKNNRFAVVVCSDVRNKKNGAYYDFPGDIKATFKRNGLVLYNEFIIVDPVGTAAIRSQRYMRNRKAARVHQLALVFYKGNTGEIQKIFPEIEVADGSEDLEF